MISLLSLVVTELLLLGIRPIHVHAEFNFEVGRRIHERVSGFMGTPTSILLQTSEYRDNQGFSHDLRAPDRDAYFRFNDAIMETYPEFQSIYYGLEDGMFAGHGFDDKIANYREPGHSGYPIDQNGDASDEMQKHYLACVNATSGDPRSCEMKVGGKYTECVNGCDLDKCADEDSQRDCSAISYSNELTTCEAKIKWCTSYVIKEVTEGERRGYVGRSTYCINSHGIPSEAPGEISKKGTDELGSCYFTDDVTPVKRKNIMGDYAYCGGEAEDLRVCAGTFEGAYLSRDYDPRWRGWYIATKALQMPNWSPPYPFFTTLEIGITFSLPIYTNNDNGQRVFEGVLAIDYTFTDMSNFLQTNYKNSSTIVAIFEQDEPNYIIATSTGAPGARLVLKDDEETLCTDLSSGDCKVVRTSAAELAGTDTNAVIRGAFLQKKKDSFRQERLTSSRSENDDRLYASQVKSFSIINSKLNWQIMIMTPVTTEESDTIMVGDDLFRILIAIVCVGVTICGFLFAQLIRKRKRRAVIVSDWRFLSAFVFSCILLNLSCLSFLGPNTDELCLLRQWLVHFFFVLALSLLFVKNYHMFKLVGSSAMIRTTMSHAETAKAAAPLVLIQTVILLIFTFADPSKSEEVTEFTGSDITHRVICSHETPAFLITMLIYEGGLIIVGCVLAYKTRNLRSEFNESKQIFLSMYDTAVIATLILMVSNFALVYQGEQRLLTSMGLFWTTCFASCVFVIPRTVMKSRAAAVVISGLSSTVQRTAQLTRRFDLVGRPTRMDRVLESNDISHEHNQTDPPDCGANLDIEAPEEHLQDRNQNTSYAISRDAALQSTKAEFEEWVSRAQSVVEESEAAASIGRHSQA